MIFKVMFVITSIVNLSYGILFSSRKYDVLLNKYKSIDISAIRKKRSIELIILSIVGIFVPSSYFIGWVILSVLLGFRSEFKFYSLSVQIREQLNYEFPIWIRFVQSNLQNNTVYQSLVMSKDNCSWILKENIEELLKQVEKAPYQIQNYESFMNEFNSFEVKKMMMHLYRYNFTGFEESKNQLQAQIKASNTWIESTRHELYQKQREWYKWLVVLPMLSVTFLFIILMFQVMISIMEGGGWSI